MNSLVNVQIKLAKRCQQNLGRLIRWQPKRNGFISLFPKVLHSPGLSRSTFTYFTLWQWAQTAPRLFCKSCDLPTESQSQEKTWIKTIRRVAFWNTGDRISIDSEWWLAQSNQTLLGRFSFFWSGGFRLSSLLLCCTKESQPPPAIHYLKCVCSRRRAGSVQMHDGKECWNKLLEEGNISQDTVS